MRNPYERVISFNHSRDVRFLPIKYRLMASSTFRFFRGSCHLFYEDLAQNQTWKDKTMTWICGDLHLENFGTYRSRHQVIYFDLNDFDEAILAHPTWEVARFVCSIFLAGHELNIKNDELKTIAMQIIEEYLITLQNGKAFAIEKETVAGVLKKYIKVVSERDPLEFLNLHSSLDKITKQRTLRIDQKKYFAIHDQELKAKLIKVFSDHLEYLTENIFHVCDVAIRVAGTGSIGLSRYVYLIFDTEQKTYTLFDMKQAQPSSLSLSPFLKSEQPAWTNHAERIQVIQTMMQYETPAWLSHLHFQDQTYIVKVLQPEQDKMDLKQYIEKPKKFLDACLSMTQLMGYAQLRSAGRKGSANIDELIQFADQAELWKAQLLEYTYNYVQQVKQDYQSFSQTYQASLDVSN